MQVYDEDKRKEHHDKCGGEVNTKNVVNEMVNEKMMPLKTLNLLTFLK